VRFLQDKPRTVWAWGTYQWIPHFIVCGKWFRGESVVKLGQRVLCTEDISF